MATQRVACSYQEIIDLHTESDKVSVIGIHTPTGDTPHRMFKGFFDQFKKFAYLGASISLVPAARLPVDPLQVSYDAGEPTIDPRDTLNPILWHGAHGEDLGNILNSLYAFGTITPGVGQSSLVDEFAADSVDLSLFENPVNNPLEDMTLLEKLYYKALTDNSWKKAHPQRGFRKSGLRPMVYKVSSTHQIMPSSSWEETYIDQLDQAAIAGYPTGSIQQGTPVFMPHTSVRAENILATRLTGLGYLDTRTPLSLGSYSIVNAPSSGGKYDYNAAVDELFNQNSHLTELPKIFMGIILLPPAYKTEQYFRLIINHRFVFAKFRSISFQNDLDEDTPSYFNWNEELSTDNNLGSGESEPTMSLSESVTLPFTPGVEVSVYSKLTIDGTDYTNNGSSGTWGSNKGFALYNDKVYLASWGSSSMSLLNNSSNGVISISTASSASTSTIGGMASGAAISPSDSDLLADLIDGGIDYDGE